MLTLDSKIEQIAKIGPAYLKKFHKLEIKTIRDLFFHFPHRYDDFSQRILINELKEGQVATIQGAIVDIKNTRFFHRKMTLTECLVKDSSGSIKVVWYNQPFLINNLKPGKLVNISGKLSYYKKTLCFISPAHELAKADTVHTGRLVPIYHETTGLSSKYLRYVIKPLLYLTDKFSEFLPAQIITKYRLLNINQAIRQIHFPETLELAQRARYRLSFDELFLIQLSSLQQKARLDKENGVIIPFNKKLIRSFVKELPFALTDDQRLAAWEVFQDFNKGKPMNRLLNGDVGSGKTMVAILAALEIAKANYQVALMAPTEILARQHFDTFTAFLKKHKLKICLLTNSQGQINKKKATKPKLKNDIKKGKVNIIIGTHALIQQDISFDNLALAIIDEQHRFGVGQRAALQNQIYQAKDGLPTIPHLLSMTATPIPRTLSLTIYGDLDISIIKQLPQGRKKIVTKLVNPKSRTKAYSFIGEQIQAGRQAFVICPLIDESDKLGVKSVTQEFDTLSKEIFPEFKIAMLHGKLKPKEKEKIMEDFKNGKTDILVSTSVVEVGVDVPNASVMIIEGADRFGLAQLHQFRGRIGRGQYQSHCYLFTDSPSAKTNQRLKAIITAKDGFELAEQDLKIRGPGDFIGTRQSGLPDLVMASIDNIELIKQARTAAQETIAKKLITPELKKRIQDFTKLVHLE